LPKRIIEGDEDGSLNPIKRLTL